MELEILESQMFLLITLSLAVFRIYLQVINFDFAKLPISSHINQAAKFHKYGFYASIGYFVLFAPQFLLS